MGIETLTQFDWIAFARATAPLIAVLATAMGIIVIASVIDDEESGFSGWLALIGLSAAFALAWRLWPASRGANPSMEISIDRLAIAGWMAIFAASAFASALAMPYLKACSVRRADFFGLLMLATFGMGVLSAGSDLISILIGLEAMSLAAYALTGYLRERPASIEGAFKYFIIGAFGTAFFLMGIAFIFGSAGSTDLAMISSRAVDIASGEGRAFFLFGVAMAVVGFSFKVAVVPFHAWAPDAYEGAPTPVTSFMATGIKAAAFLAFMRFAVAVAPAVGIMWHHLMWGLAALTMILGNLAAIRQENLKRMLAYSSIAHAGYILVSFPMISADPKGAGAAILFYLVSYIVMTSGAFAAVTAIGLISGEPVEIYKLAGLARRRPFLAASFTLFLLSLAGFPPTLGFFGKYYLFLFAVKNGDTPLVCLAVITSVISVFYYLRPVVAMYFRQSDKPDVERTALQVAPAVVAVLAVASMAVIVFGIVPGDLLSLVQGSLF